MAARPSPRAPHSSTCPKLSAALSPSRRPVSGLVPPSEPLAQAPIGSFGHSPCTGLTIARGPRLQRPVSPAAGGGEEGGESAGPALRRAARTTAVATERAGRGGTCAQATPHRVTPIGPDARGGWAGPARRRALSSARPLRLSTRGLQPVLQVLFCSTAWFPDSLFVSDRTEICLRHLHGSPLLPFPVTFFQTG